MKSSCVLIASWSNAAFQSDRILPWYIADRPIFYEMLRVIPTISTEGLNAYFDSIDAKLSDNENLSDAPMLLGVAIPNNDFVRHVLPCL
jgi:hypothetical protein